MLDIASPGVTHRLTAELFEVVQRLMTSNLWHYCSPVISPAKDLVLHCAGSKAGSKGASHLPLGTCSKGPSDQD